MAVSLLQSVTHIVTIHLALHGLQDCERGEIFALFSGTTATAVLTRVTRASNELDIEPRRRRRRRRQRRLVYDRNSFLSILQKHIYCTQNVTEILFNRKGNLLLLQTVIAYFLPLSVLKRGCFCCFSVLISANTMVSNRN